MRAEGIETARRILCVFPRYTSSFGTFEYAYPLTDGVQAFMPPQGLLLIAAYLPASWPVRFIDAARAYKADLIVMSTHGRSGVGRLICGSVAESVLRGTTIPIFLRRPPEAPVELPSIAAPPMEVVR